jgi:hypothetical protein
MRKYYFHVDLRSHEERSYPAVPENSFTYHIYTYKYSYTPSENELEGVRMLIVGWYKQHGYEWVTVETVREYL